MSQHKTILTLLKTKPALIISLEIPSLVLARFDLV
jgi:hypothetical protein